MKFGPMTGSDLNMLHQALKKIRGCGMPEKIRKDSPANLPTTCSFTAVHSEYYYTTYLFLQRIGLGN